MGRPGDDLNRARSVRPHCTIQKPRQKRQERAPSGRPWAGAGLAPPRLPRPRSVELTVVITDQIDQQMVGVGRHGQPPYWLSATLITVGTKEVRVRPRLKQAEVVSTHACVPSSRV